MENFKKFFAGALTLAITFGIFTVFSFSSGDEFLGRVSVKSQDNGQKVQRVKQQRAQNVERTKTTRQRRATRNTAAYKESSKQNVRSGKRINRAARNSATYKELNKKNVRTGERINRAAQSDAAYKKRSRQNVKSDQRNTARRTNTAAREARLKQVCSKYFSANNGLQRQLSQRQEERLKKICDQYSNSNQGNEQRDKENEKPTPPDSNPVIETYIGACNDPFGSPSCVVEGEYTTDDLELGSGQLVYTMRVTNTSSTTPMYMDKVFIEYDVAGLNPSVWSRTDWKIYENSPSGTLLTRGVLLPSGNVSFDWAFPGSDHHPVNQPPVIPPNGSQIYAVTVNLVDDAVGFDSADYVQVRADDSSTFTPITGGTLAEARAVNSHFIWHDDAGRYYNEGYVDLMDMWGSVASATAQWRKREYPAVEPSGPVTVEFNELPAGEPYSGIILPYTNYKVADLSITATTTPVYLEQLVLTNAHTETLDFSDTFTIFYLTEPSDAILDMSPMTGSLTENDEVVFAGALGFIPAGTTRDFEVHVEVLDPTGGGVNPIIGTTNTGQWLNLYLEGTTSDDIILRPGTTPDIAPLLSSEIVNVADDGDPFQQEHFVRASKPIIEVENGVVSPTITGSVNDKMVYMFRVHADVVGPDIAPWAPGPIEWKRFTFDVEETSGLTSDDYTIYIHGDSAPINSTGASVSGGQVVIDADTPQVIPEGGFAEYMLVADIAITDVTTDQDLSITLTAADDTAHVIDSAPDLMLAGADFIWSDRSYVPHMLSTEDWANGYLIEEFDEDTMNIYYTGTGDEAAGLRFFDYYSDEFDHPPSSYLIPPYVQTSASVVPILFETETALTIPSLRVYLDGTVVTDGRPTTTHATESWLDSGECTNLSELSAVLNRKILGLNAIYHSTLGVLPGASSDDIVATSGVYTPSPTAPDGGPTCVFEAYMDLNLGTTAFDGFNQMNTSLSFDYLWPSENVNFALDTFSDTTSALSHPAGVPLAPSEITPASGPFPGHPIFEVYSIANRTSLLRLLFHMKGESLLSGPSVCPDAGEPWAEEIWHTGVTLDLIDPHPDGVCGVFDTVARAEAAKVLFNYGHFVMGTLPLSDTLGVFPDVPPTTWFAPFVDSLFAVGVPVGFPAGMFMPFDEMEFIDWHNWIASLS